MAATSAQKLHWLKKRRRQYKRRAAHFLTALLALKRVLAGPLVCELARLAYDGIAYPRNVATSRLDLSSISIASSGPATRRSAACKALVATPSAAITAMPIAA